MNMNRSRLVLRSIVFYRRSWLGVLAGTALTAMIITGALLIGDSAHLTLRNIALQRLGQTELAMAPRRLFFSDDLAERMQDKLGIDTCALLQLHGVAISMMDGKGQQINNVQVLGVQANFWKFTEDYSLAPDGVAINERLAQALDLQAGDEIALRIEKPGIFPRDAPLSSRLEDLTARRIFIVDAVVMDEDLGRFSLENSQRTPHNIFLGRSVLQDMADMDGKSNVMLVKRDIDHPLNSETADRTLHAVYQPEDFGLRFRRYANLDLTQIESESIYIPEAVSSAVQGCDVLTYMVNSISSGDRLVPYSFATAMEPSPDKRFGPVPPGMRNDEVLINSWLAKRLDVQIGDKVDICYYHLMPSNQLVEQTNSFRIHALVDIAGLESERRLTPRFPGLTDVESCAEWDIGMPMDSDLLEDPANEEYWDQYRETPKLFTTLAAGQRIWGNRFGETTAIRLASGEELEARKSIRTKVAPSGLGYHFMPVREQALRSIDEAIDLGQLFLGMSFFLMISALLIIAFLFGLAVQRRAGQCGLMLACGYRRKGILAIMLSEGGIVAAFGAAIGIVASFFYTRLLLHGIGAAWQGAVASTAIQFHYQPLSLAFGWAATVACALLVMYLVLRRQLWLPASRQMRGDVSEPRSGSGPGYALFLKVTAWLATGAALAVTGMSLVFGDPAHSAPSFFLAGILLLIASILFMRNRIFRPHPTRLPFRVSALIRNNIGRRGNHSLGIIAVLACGCFLVFAVSSMKENLLANADERGSGTGGFDLFAQSTVPLLDGLGTAEANEEYHLEGAALDTAVNIKLRAGDDSSCFNLNRAVSPTLLGIDAGRMAELGAFEDGHGEDSVWRLLDMELPDGAIPAIVGDSDTLVWGLEKRAGVEDGDILEYRNELGQDLKVRIVASLPMRLSVFQGKLLISQKNFVFNFPFESGYKIFLIDAAEADSVSELRNLLNRRLERYGFEAVPSAERLQEFYAVESAYLSIFLVLGGLGLLLGAAGMGTIVWRNLVERRAEIELLYATGFAGRKISAILACEYIALLLTGVLCGCFAALLAIIPNLVASGVSLPWQELIYIALGICVTGAAFILISIVFATKSGRALAADHE